MPVNMTQAVAAARAAGFSQEQIETAAANQRGKPTDFDRATPGWLAVATPAQVLGIAAYLTAEAWRRRAQRNGALTGGR